PAKIREQDGHLAAEEFLVGRLAGRVQVFQYALDLRDPCGAQRLPGIPGDRFADALHGLRSPGGFHAKGRVTGLRIDAERSMASVTSSVRRASAAVASAQGLPSARWSSQARVSFAIGPQKSPSAQSPGVPLWRNTMLTEWSGR